MTIRRLLVANRAEIAGRVFRTCRDLGIETVAVHSDADAGLPFVAAADLAVRLPGRSPAETYLRGDLLVDAARRAGADAVHPGYGFCSESAGFARQVVAAGLTWVGPTPESIEQMGSKVAAKKLMAAAGVPVLEAVDPAAATEEDLPLLVKAAAGGGGRGMRVVRSLAELEAAVSEASAEAASAFGDPTVFCEPYVARGRHVEVQVVGDQHGHVVVLGERDCSIQRRHQKVIEETPAPALAQQTRTALLEAARAAAAAIGYVGAGTVEFLYDPESPTGLWFLEMNTRLQVEHPVTECVTGVDLVALQIRVAEGAALEGWPSAAPDGRSSGTGGGGHAVEARLYAEDPAAGWAPQSGRLTRLEVPGAAAQFAVPASYGIRLDAGYRTGDLVGTDYDAMLAKVVAWAPSRAEALRMLAGALARARIHGVRTNRDLLVEVLRHPAMAAGEVSTDFLQRHRLGALQQAGDESEAADPHSAFVAAVALAERDRSLRAVQRGVPASWRNVVSQPQLTRFAVRGATVEVRWFGGRGGYRPADDPDTQVVEAAPDLVVLDIAGVRHRFEVCVTGEAVDVESARGHTALRRLPRFVPPAERLPGGSLLAPMPGTVVDLPVAVGDPVGAGQPVVVLEAMKMQHKVLAPHDGVLTDLPVTAGAQVAAGSVLAVVTGSTEGNEGP